MSAFLRTAAPGKLFLGGEYAVLEGAEAVVTAVDATAVASTARSGSRSPVICAVVEQMSRFLGIPSSEMPAVKVQSRDFRLGRRKIGLGSSAAVSAAACGLLFEWAGLSIEAHRENILDLATSAHRAAQGGLGSGADVACSVLGETMIFAGGKQAERVKLKGIHLAAAWTGRAASTSDLLRRIDTLARTDPALHRDCFCELGSLSMEIAKAYRLGDPQYIIFATRQYGESMKRLGQAASAPIVVAEHERAASLALRFGGAAKPSGAGGGDAAIAVFGERDAAMRFLDQCPACGLVPLDLSFGAPGLHRVR